MKTVLLLLLVLVVVLAAVGFYQLRKTLPQGLNYRGPDRILNPDTVQFLADITAKSDKEGLWISQEIFDEIFRKIREAKGFVVADFFLINDFAGGMPGDEEEAETLSRQFIEALVDAKRANPGMPVILITDPLNTIYGAVEQPLFELLAGSGVEVVTTKLSKLRDSNWIYSSLWRTLLSWWGDPRAFQVNNPIGEGKIGVSAFLEMLNFKANHRKTLVTGTVDGSLYGLVTSANPHSGSAHHGNVALAFTGPLAADLLRSEEAVYRMSTGTEFPEQVRSFMEPVDIREPSDEKSLTAVVLTEQAIKRELLDRIDRLDRGDVANMALFYFSDFDLRSSLARAVSRGATVRLLMDPNKDAFGREKNGIPNRQVGIWLAERGVNVRWYQTSGEQFHSKMALFLYGDIQASLVLGSANWTRRNLNNFNLETAVSLSGPVIAPVFVDAADYFSFVWTNGFRRNEADVPSDLVTSVPFEAYRDPNIFRKVLYWFMEKTGLSTF